ncbi:MAG: ribose-phosphate pyrophosphokinase [Myxococcales bacterium]|nr:ribose-phosphate pyrophosphokinase [Myxococcales bacterium]
MDPRIKIFAGSSHPELARAICAELDMPLAKSETVKFSNENLMVKIQENVRGCDVYFIQTSAPPVNENIVEMLIAIDALKGASAARVTAVMPYYFYARSDKKDRPRISIAARLMADLLQTAGADRVLCMDLHSPQIQGFFRIPVDQLVGAPILATHMKTWDIQNGVLVAGDVGEAKELGRFANLMGLPVAIVDKRRYGDDDRAVATNLIGDVEGKHAIIVDDEIATGGTIIEAANFLFARGALSVKVAATHGVLSGPAIARIHDSRIDTVLVTDTIPLRDKLSDKVRVLSVAPVFAKAIRRIHDGDSVSDLF